MNIFRCLFQKSVSIEKSVRLFSTNANKFVRVKGSNVDALGLKTDESGELLETFFFFSFLMADLPSRRFKAYTSIQSFSN